MNTKLKPCKTCGVKPVVETWASGGLKFAIRCDNPNRPESCSIPFYLSISKSKDEAINKWNEYQETIKTE